VPRDRDIAVASVRLRGCEQFSILAAMNKRAPTRARSSHRDPTMRDAFAASAS
jgi:hypothetical protein